MNKVHERLFVSNISDCFYDDRRNWAVIHACKHPCHQREVRYRRSLNPSHPNYLIKERENGLHLFLNMVDMPNILKHEFTEPIVSCALNFIEKNIPSRNVLIHCNQGQSRAPSLALLFLAKRAKIISNDSYQKAKNEFREIFPQYVPGRGIEMYLSKYWDSIN